MSENPYAPPTAQVADIDSGLPDNSNPLFAVGTAKVVVMSICTFGIYHLYWFYRNWNLIRARDRSDIMPFWRAFFGIFWCYSAVQALSRGRRSAWRDGRIRGGDRWRWHSSCCN